jgi:hypothetical protein
MSFQLRLNNFVNNLYFVGFSGLAIGLPTSKVILSMSMFLLLFSLILEGNYAAYLERLRKNKPYLILLAFWTLHLFALLWTTDFNYAFQDIRIKLTLLVIPTVILSKPLEKNQVNIWMYLFLATLLVTSIFNVAQYQGFIGSTVHNDIRGLSFFGSHIRYGILIAMGAGISIFLANYEKSLTLIVSLIFLFLWFVLYTYYSQVLSGFLALLCIIIVYFSSLAFKKSLKLGLAFICGIFFLFGTFIYYLSCPQENLTINYDQLATTTALGNSYTHNLDPSTFVEGKPVFANVCEQELQAAWNKISALDYNGYDKKKQPLRFTIMRYMTSKDLKKDANGIGKLSANDIQNIENGITSYGDLNAGLFARLSGLRYQLHNSEDPNGHSLLQRIEYWKTAIKIIEKNWVFGVGTGDVQVSFDQQYKEDNSRLTVENRLRAHNMYLTIWLTFGILGLFLFLYLNVTVFLFCLKCADLIGIMFLSIALVTFTIEDTLETQTGVSFFAIFLTLSIMKYPAIRSRLN